VCVPVPILPVLHARLSTKGYTLRLSLATYVYGGRDCAACACVMLPGVSLRVNLRLWALRARYGSLERAGGL